MPLGYATVNGDLFNLPAGPVSFALGGEYDAPRWTRDRDALNTTFQSIGSTDGGSARVNRDVWSIYQEVRVPFTSPTWNFPDSIASRLTLPNGRNGTARTPPQFYLLDPSHFSRRRTASITRRSQKFPSVGSRLIPSILARLPCVAATPKRFMLRPYRRFRPLPRRGSKPFDPFSTQYPSRFEKRVIGNPNLHPEVAYEWSYGVVYSPKWIKGLTLSADWWHIDMRSIVSLLGTQFIIENNNPGLVFRGPPAIPGEPGPIVLVIDPNENLTGAIFEGLDYEAIYILDSSIFGHGDFGRLTATVNGTWLSRAELQILPDTKRFGIAGEFIPPGFSLTSSLPWNRANFSLFYDGPADTWVLGLDIGAVVHYTGQYEDDNVSLTGTTFRLFAEATKPSGGPCFGACPESVCVDHARPDCILHVQPAATRAGRMPGYAKDGGKNVKMKDGKEKNVLPVSTAEYGKLEMVAQQCHHQRWLAERVR